jgi:hypothetical protein
VNRTDIFNSYKDLGKEEISLRILRVLEASDSKGAGRRVTLRGRKVTYNQLFGDYQV